MSDIKVIIKSGGLTSKSLTSKSLNIDSLSLNRVSKSLEEFYNSIIYVNDIASQIEENSFDLINNTDNKNKFVDILGNYVDNKYFDNNEDYFFIHSVPSVSKSNANFDNNLTIYTQRKFNKYSGVPLKDLLILKNNKTPLYFENEYNNMRTELIVIRNTLELFKKQGLLRRNYFILIQEWNNAIKVCLFCILNINNIYPNTDGIESDFICIGSGVQLDNIIQETENIKLFSPEYLQLIKEIEHTIYEQSIIAYYSNIFLSGSNIIPINNNLKINENFHYDIWELTDEAFFSKCLFSSRNISWTNKFASEVYKLDEELDIVNTLQYIFDFIKGKLFIKNYGEVGIIEYKSNDKNYAYICKLIIYEGKQYIILTEILINKFFKSSLVNYGDTRIEGSVDILNYDDTSVFKLDTYSKSLNINGKIGINTTNSSSINIDSLLDIKGISVNEIILLKEKMVEFHNFIYDYFDYFIDNFSLTNERNWNTIFDNFFRNDEISVTNILLPFNIIDSNIDNELLLEVLNNFEKFILFDMLEKQVNIQELEIEGKYGDELTNSYYDDYLNKLKEYFVILLNQREFISNGHFQTFTNVVNYFDGPVLRIHIFWIDNEKVMDEKLSTNYGEMNIIRVFATNLRMDNYLLNKNLSVYFRTYFNALYSCEQLTNITFNYLSNESIQEELFEDTLSLTERINNSIYKSRFGFPNHYIFGDEYNPENINECRVLFNEVLPYWKDQFASKLLLPGQDKIVSEALLTIFENMKKYNIQHLFKTQIVDYSWLYEHKISYVKIINIKNKSFLVGSGVDIVDYIPISFKNNGDIVTDGSLKIDNFIDKKTVMKVDNIEKKILFQYPLGIGTENPRSLLTINDVSITNIFAYIDEVSRKGRYINDLVKVLSGRKQKHYKRLIETYINPFDNNEHSEIIISDDEYENNSENNSENDIEDDDKTIYFYDIKFEQDFENYFGITEVDPINIKNSIFHYSWFSEKWIGKTFEEILVPSFDPVNNKIKPFVEDYLKKFVTETLIQNNLSSLIIYEWIWGKKATFGRNFIDNTGKIKHLYMGVNLNKYFTNFNRNINLQNILIATQSLITQSNLIYLDYINNIILNSSQISLFLDNLNKNYNNNKVWICDATLQISDIKLYLTQGGDFPNSLNLLKETDSLFRMIVLNGEKGNLTNNDVLKFKEKIVNARQEIERYNKPKNFTSVDKIQYLSNGDTNIIHYRTSDEYFIAYWLYVQDVEITTKNNTLEKRDLFLFIEFNVDDYLNQSIQLLGDLQIGGNLTLMDPKDYYSYVINEKKLSELKPLISLYPEENFVGIGSQEIFTAYALDYNTINLLENNSFAKNHTLISNEFFPNLVCERIDKDNNYDEDHLSSISLRRRSKNKNLEELKISKKYGVDIGFEFQDKYNITYEIGNFGVRLNDTIDIDNPNDNLNITTIKHPIPSFFWDCTIGYNKTINEPIKKDIMSVELEKNDDKWESCLNIDKIKLGGKYLYVNENGDLMWGSDKVHLENVN
jgi:hypothetical protein